MKTVLDFKKAKIKQQKLSMMTCYDATFAKILNDSNIDMVLVGDSLGMTIYGHDTTIPVTVEMMALHVEAVRRGAPDKFIIADMPFLSHRKDIKSMMDAVDMLMKAGANGIKIEGGEKHAKQIEYVIDSGVPVMGHLGLTPQSVHHLGGFKVQAKEAAAALQLENDAKILEEIGCFSIVLECIPEILAKNVTNQVSVPTIGIGAGQATDGQVLVIYDVLGLSKDFRPKFVKTYWEGHELIAQAVNEFDREVKSELFPSKEHSFAS